MIKINGTNYTMMRAADGVIDGIYTVIFSNGGLGSLTLAFNNGVFDPENSAAAVE